MMLPHALLLALVAAGPHPSPPRLPTPPPALEDPRAHQPAAIFTYRVNGRCGITGVRKLQGWEDVRWSDAEAELGIFREAMVFRYVGGLRTRLRERRVRLLGELVEPGELVCHLRPSGDLVDAWIERHDPSPARRRAPRRDPVVLREGRVTGLGTYSIIFQPHGFETTARDSE